MVQCISEMITRKDACQISFNHHQKNSQCKDEKIEGQIVKDKYEKLGWASQDDMKFVDFRDRQDKK